MDKFQIDEFCADLTTPLSDKSSLIVPDEDSDFITNNDFEYDDFIPELPGSYLDMDTSRYTLTWSKRKN